MSLKVWLPLNGDIKNQGLSDLTYSGNPVYKSNGKLGNKCLDLSTRITFNCPSLNYIKTYSVAFWAKVNSDTTQSTNWVDVIGFTDRTSDGSATGQLRWETCYASSSVTRGISSHDNATNATSNGLGVIVGEGKDVWHHISITVDVENNKINEYCNGLLVHTTTTNGGSLTGAFWIGETNKINGEIQDVRIYDHALSVKEIAEISKGLALHYKLSDFGNNNILTNTHFDTRYSQTTGWDTTKNGTLLASGWSGYNSGVTNASTVYHAHLKLVDDVYVYEYIKTANETWLGISQGGSQTRLTSGQTYTFSWDQYCVDGANYVGTGLYYYKTGATSAAFHLGIQYGNTDRILGKWQHFSYTFTAPSDADYSKNMSWYIYGHYGGNGTFYMKNPKLELGDEATPWYPNTADSAYSILNLSDTAEYDCSGYGNDGTKTNITISGDSIRYSTSYVFNGSNSYIKINDSFWKSDGSTELSTNIWAYMDDWTTFNTRLYSCTEGGGYNVEPNGNNIAFTMSAYTNAEKSAYKYINDGGYCDIAKSSLTPGWHMFTYVYTTTGTKLYVDSILKVNNTYTSYGVHYNMTAPLVIGAEATGSGVTSPYFNGKMNDFKLFYTELNEEDIKDLYQVSASVDDKGNIYSYEVVEQ